MRLSLLLALAATLTACNKDPDLDEDGFPASVDCDDEDASIHPDAEEVCDGIDNNCDAITDVDATDVVTWYADSDGDGFGGDAITFDACEAPAGFLPDNNDCDDNDATVSPDGLEICDGKDNDCDGLTDSDDDSVDPSTATDWYPDADGDGYGVDADAVQSCSAPDSTYVLEGGDCDDSDAALSPATVWYADLDGDGYGATNFTTVQCEQPGEHTAAPGDCDDFDSSINPDAQEVCDGGIDNDCDGLAEDADDSLDLSTRTLWYADNDSDGYGDSEDAGALYCAGPSGTTLDNSDCDDGDTTISPDATEVCDDGIDNDCSGDAPECGFTGDLTTADANTTFTGSNSFARHFDANGDFDGDGYDDLLVSGSAYSSGSAYIYFGSATVADADLDTDGVAILGDSAAYFGIDVASIGDSNGDGYDDLVVGAYGEETVYFLYGSSSAQSDWASIASSADMDGSLSMPSVGGFGYTLNAVGDLNGDGMAELVVGAGDDESAYLFYGSTTMFSGDLDVSGLYDASFDDNGSDDESFVTAENQIAGGDFDGDGNDDLVLSDYWNDNGSYDAGRVFIFMGSSAGMSGDYEAEDADYKLNGSNSSDKFGVAINSAGDVDNDGYEDLLVGAEGYDSGSSYSNGAAALFYGSVSGISGTSMADADFVLTGVEGYDYLGSSVYGADINGDSNSDLIVGADGAGASSSAGVAYVVLGGVLSGTLDAGSADANFEGVGSYDYFGGYDASVGDLDGDGTYELFLSATSDDELFRFVGGGM